MVCDVVCDDMVCDGKIDGGDENCVVVSEGDERVRVMTAITSPAPL